jgi:tetratricopeptide (TPR) repeat protein
MKIKTYVIVLLSIVLFSFQSCGPNPKKFRLHLENGIELLFKAQHEKALQEFELAVKYNPDSFEAYYYRGAAKQNLHNIEGALEDFLKSIELNPSFPESYFSIAQVYDNRNDKETACYYYLKAEEFGKPNVGDYTRWCK